MYRSSKGQLRNTSRSNVSGNFLAKFLERLPSQAFVSNFSNNSTNVGGFQLGALWTLVHQWRKALPLQCNDSVTVTLDDPFSEESFSLRHFALRLASERNLYRIRSSFPRDKSYRSASRSASREAGGNVNGKHRRSKTPTGRRVAPSAGEVGSDLPWPGRDQRCCVKVLQVTGIPRFLSSFYFAAGATVCKCSSVRIFRECFSSCRISGASESKVSIKLCPNEPAQGRGGGNWTSVLSRQWRSLESFQSGDRRTRPAASPKAIDRTLRASLHSRTLVRPDRAVRQ